MTTQANTLIDCSADPIDQPGLVVIEHRKGGILTIEDIARIELYVSQKEYNGRTDWHIDGTFIRKEIEELQLPVLNANVLDFLLENQECIPEAWKKQDLGVHFWGTIYHQPLNSCPISDTSIFVRKLIFHKFWRSSTSLIGWPWSREYNPAAILR